MVCSLWRTGSTCKRLNTNAQLRKSTCWKNSLRGNNHSLMNVMTCYFRPLDKTPLCDTKSSFKTSFIVATISASFLFSILTPACQLILAIVARYLLLYLTEVFDSFFKHSARWNPTLFHKFKCWFCLLLNCFFLKMKQTNSKVDHWWFGSPQKCQELNLKVYYWKALVWCDFCFSLDDSQLRLMYFSLISCRITSTYWWWRVWILQ